MYVTATEFKSNIGRYLSIVADEDIFIAKNSRRVAKLISDKQAKADIVRSIIGIILNDCITLEQAREERLAHLLRGKQDSCRIS